MSDDARTQNTIMQIIFVTFPFVLFFVAVTIVCVYCSCSGGNKKRIKSNQVASVTTVTTVTSVSANTV